MKTLYNCAFLILEGEEGEEEGNMDIIMTNLLPVECLSLIISLTSPRDACRMALVSRAFKSVADSDPVWLKFLPCDYKEILSRSTSSSTFSLLSLPKKDLYFSLCHRSFPVDNGTMSFQLEKEAGRKCYMMGATALSIKWADNPHNWSWISLPESRFSRVTKLKKVQKLDVKGTAELKILSSGTNYAAYLVFKLVRDRYGFRHTPIELGVTVTSNQGEAVQIRSVILDPPPKATKQAQDRGDGWMEIEMGEFFNESGHDHGEVLEFSLRGAVDNQSKRGLIIEGIELRPKDNSLTVKPKLLTYLLRCLTPVFFRKIFCFSFILRFIYRKED